MIAATAVVLVVSMAMVLARALRGPTLYDRILAANHMGSSAVLLIAVYGFFDGRPDFLDIALAYALINFIATIAVLKYFAYGDLGAAAAREERNDA